ncbi:hypothetical protein FOPG_19833 [Fusarium oxysporum f. sp. conglutinans race 2 54008]|uniref:Uncharacterized protein n=1 Tax=Fusarium oxysporum f. sp. conglutinans race 2 54008 TaxID=1089457 RepID=X0GVR0_FUSOX|nr:hypothetical protein FOPG_19833 [Fusarium oxysporum f. sp. conglutinans race 2 54008]
MEEREDERDISPPATGPLPVQRLGCDPELLPGSPDPQPPPPNVNSCHEYSPDVASSTSESPCALVVDIGNEIDVFQG